VTDERPEGLVYARGVLDVGEEQVLLNELDRLHFEEIRMHGVVAKRTARHFGVAYDYERRAPVAAADPIPEWLLPVRERAAMLAGVEPGELVEILVQRYPPGAQIGWHGDAPAFGIVVGISLLAPARMRLRRDKRGTAGVRPPARAALGVRPHRRGSDSVAPPHRAGEGAPLLDHVPDAPQEAHDPLVAVSRGCE
jgi:alkylated DNA repair dioxygenase AlkB